MGFGVYMGSFLTKAGALCTSCCPTTPPPGTPCQWVMEFLYNTGDCGWHESVAPHLVYAAVEALHEEGIFCKAGAYTPTLVKYGAIHSDGVCGEQPDGFTDEPDELVWYVCCYSHYTAWGCADNDLDSRIMMDPIGIYGGGGCPATFKTFGGAEFDFPFTNTGQCLDFGDGEEISKTSEKLQLLAGPFCSYAEAMAYKAANAAACPAYPEEP